MDKKNLRKIFKEKRKNFLSCKDDLDLKKKFDLNLCLKLISMPLWSYDRPIFGYWSFGLEPNLEFFFYKMISEGYTVALPKINQNNMSFFLWEKSTIMVKNSFGILEPFDAKEMTHHENIKAIVLTPALAIDPFGYRLGYGGGYYDRWYEKYPNNTYLGISWSCGLATEALPQEPWDLKLTQWITES